MGGESEPADDERYQSVFAQTPGALAAPTAGLHFTAEILSEIPHVFVTLHVGPGTFRPVHSENLAEHRMHAESFSISKESAAKIDNALRIVAVGTTTVRAFETVARRSGRNPGRPIFSFIRPIDFSTSIFSSPIFICRARPC